MNISATNCTPIKPQASFGGNEKGNSHIDKELPSDEYTRTIIIADKANEDLVNSDSIKKPIAAAASVALAGLVAFVSGKKIAQVATSVCKTLPTTVENTLKKSSSIVQEKASKLASESSGKLAKAKNITGKALKKTEEFARKGYTKIAYSGIADNVVNPERANKAFQNVVGAATVAATVPVVCSKDSDGNGVADLMEKTTNAYAGTTKKCSSAVQGASQIAELISELT